MNGLREMFRYEVWASRRLLARLREVRDLDPRVRKLFAHIQVGLKVWALRIRGEDSRAVAIWPDLTLEEAEALIAENEAAYAGILSVPEGLLAEKISYTNQHGLHYQTAIADILPHVITHCVYHRGQIALLLRQAGEDPLNTDYITYVREKAGQPWKP